MAFREQIEKSLSDDRLKPYFVRDLIRPADISARLDEETIFDDATKLASFVIYDEARSDLASQALTESKLFKIARILVRLASLRVPAEWNLATLLSNWLSDAYENVVMPNAVSIANELLGRDRKRLVILNYAGLRKLQDPTVWIPTSSLARIEYLLKHIDGGSIALAGPRGAGKSTILRRFTDLGNEQLIGVQGMAIYAAAPAEYVPKEFMADLFQRLCEAYLQYDRSADRSGRAGSSAKSINWDQRLIKWLVRFWVFAFATSALTTLTWTIGYMRHLIIVKKFDFAAWLRDLTSVATPHPISFPFPLDLILYEAIIVLLVGAIAVVGVSGSLRRWRQKTRPTRSELHKRTSENLLRLRFDRTISRNTSLGFPAVKGLSFGLSRELSISHVPWTAPELVAETRRFLSDVATELSKVNRKIYIGIDEIDRIRSVEQAEYFMGEIKAIFGVTGCYFLVAVAEDVGSAFAQRSTSGRSMVESAFDEVVSVPPLGLDEARNLLMKRVVGCTDAFVYLIYVLSGGLPREIIRVSRRVIQIGLEQSTESSYAQVEDVALVLANEALIENIDAARSHIASLSLGPAWAETFDLLRITSALLKRPDLSRKECYAAIELVSNIVGYGDRALSAELDAGRIVRGTSAFALFSLAVIDAFSDEHFDLNEVKERSRTGAAGSYEELASAKLELSVSAASAKLALYRFRQRLS